MSASEGNICLPLNVRHRGLKWEDCEFKASLGYRVSAYLKGYKRKHFNIADTLKCRASLHKH